MTGDDRSLESAASAPAGKSEFDSAAPSEFRWQALFQRSSEPLFLLNSRRQILFVNKAWESLTGITATEARGLRCIRRAEIPGEPWDLVVRALCCPPPEVLQGKPSRSCRLLPPTGKGKSRWNIDFLPLGSGDGLLCVLGKISVEASTAPPCGPPLPEKLLALREARARRYCFQDLVSKLPSVARVLEQARLASNSHFPFLLQGEPGTGKEWLARAVHNESDSRQQAFIAVDCERLSPAMVKRVLFDKAVGSSPGRRTFYLREPAFLPRDCQAELCQRISDADRAGQRIIAGSTIDSLQAIRDGRLVEAFHYAVSPLVITLPPLRDRLDDLPDLVERMLAQANALGQHRITGLTSEAWDLLRAYPWPGNLRELFASLRDACVKATDELLEPLHFPHAVRLHFRMDRPSREDQAQPLSLDRVLEEAERRLIVLALKRAGGNKSRAAELLSVWRPRLLRRMQALGITGGTDE